MKKIIIIGSLLLLVTINTFADLAPPGGSSNRIKKPESGVSATMTIKLDRNATEAKLIIPRLQLKQLRAELEHLDNDEPVAAVADVSRFQTIMGGLFLSLAVIFGGLWFVRSGSVKGTKAIALLAAAGVLASAATIIYANVGPPIEARSITSRLFDQKLFTPYRFASGKVTIVAGDDDTFQLIVPDVEGAVAKDE